MKLSTLAPPLARTLAPLRDRPGRAILMLAGLVAMALGVGLGRAAAPERPAKLVVATATPKHTPTGASVRWRRPAVAFRVDAGLVAAYPKARDAVAGALGAWSGVAPGVPTLSLTDDAATPNVVRLAPAGFVMPHDALAVTRLTFASDTGDIVSAEILIDATRHPFSCRDAGDDERGDDERSDAMPYDLQSVLAHETGHSLGLGEDYVDGAATMFVSTMPGDVSKRQLSADDRGAISQVYGEDGAAAAPSKGCSLEGRPVGNGRPLAFLLLGALAVARRRRDARG